MNMNNKRFWYHVSKFLMFVGTFTAPFYIILPSNAGLYEIFIIISAICLLITGDQWSFPSGRILAPLILVFIGYSLSILNSVAAFEAFKFIIQFGFIICIQAPLVFTLTQRTSDFYLHSLALFLSIVVISVYFVIGFFTGDLSTSSNVTLFYSNYNNMAVIILVILIPSSFFVYHVNWRSFFGDSYYYIPLIMSALVLIIGLLAMLSTQSRRIYPALIILLPIVLATKFFSITNIKKIMSNTVKMSLFSMLFGSIIVLQNLYPQDMFSRITDTITGDHSGGGIEERFRYIEQGNEVFLSLFPLGTGYNNYGYYSDLPEPHNMFLEPIVEGGILAGIGIFLLFITIAAMAARRIIFKQNWDPVVMSFSVAMIAFIIAHMFGTLLILRVHWLIFILAALSVHNTKP